VIASYLFDSEYITENQPHVVITNLIDKHKDSLGTLTNYLNEKMQSVLCMKVERLRNISEEIKSTSAGTFFPPLSPSLFPSPYFCLLNCNLY
jgi:hypothetical protein